MLKRIISLPYLMWNNKMFNIERTFLSGIGRIYNSRKAFSFKFIYYGKFIVTGMIRIIVLRELILDSDSSKMIQIQLWFVRCISTRLV